LTEIPVFFPEAEPPGPVPEPGDWHGMFTGISVGLGRIARNLPDPRRIRLEKARAVWSVRVDPTPIQLAAGAGILDLPQTFGPGLGYNWDVHTISATGFTAGTVSGWINVPSLANLAGGPAGALRAPFTAAGVLNFGKNQLFLRHGERLVFIASGITGSVLISFDATSLTDEYVGEYLL
jgi:hypothetical protein